MSEELKLVGLDRDLELALELSKVLAEEEERQRKALSEAWKGGIPKHEEEEAEQLRIALALSAKEDQEREERKKEDSLFVNQSIYDEHGPKLTLIPEPVKVGNIDRKKMRARGDGDCAMTSIMAWMIMVLLWKIRELYRNIADDADLFGIQVYGDEWIQNSDEVKKVKEFLKRFRYVVDCDPKELLQKERIKDSVIFCRLVIARELMANKDKYPEFPLKYRNLDDFVKDVVLTSLREVEQPVISAAENVFGSRIVVYHTTGERLYGLEKDSPAVKLLYNGNHYDLLAPETEDNIDYIDQCVDDAALAASLAEQMEPRGSRTKEDEERERRLESLMKHIEKLKR